MAEAERPCSKMRGLRRISAQRPHQLVCCFDQEKEGLKVGGIGVGDSILGMICTDQSQSVPAPQISPGSDPWRAFSRAATLAN